MNKNKGYHLLRILWLSKHSACILFAESNSGKKVEWKDVKHELLQLL